VFLVKGAGRELHFAGCRFTQTVAHVRGWSSVPYVLVWGLASGFSVGVWRLGIRV